MESNIKASFIPDRVPTSSTDNRAPRASDGGIGDILILVAIVVLAAALALAAGVFLYDRFLETNVEKKSSQLARAEQSFEPALIEELVRLDSRLQAANQVLTRHVAPSELFNLIESLTLQSIAYSSLDYSVLEDGGIQIRLRGKAHSVNGVALQASVFGQHNAIVNPIFSNIDIVNDGVSFEVSAQVNPTALRYTTVSSRYSTETSALEEQNINFVEETQSTNQATSTEGFGDFGSTPTNQNETQ